MENKNDNQDIIFPAEKTNLLILEILEKYGVRETDTTMFEKISSKEKSIRATVAYLVKKMAMNAVDFNEVIRVLEKELAIPHKKAGLIATGLKHNIVPLAKSRDSLEEQKPETFQTKPTRSTPKSSDSYRESFE